MRSLRIHPSRWGITATLAIASIGVFASSARADHSLETIVQDDAVLLHRSDAQVASAMSNLAAMGVDRVRLTANWSAIAPNPRSSTAPSFDATDPNAYPHGAWGDLDRAVRDATADGLKVDIDIAFWAPLWATSDSDADHARRDISASEYAQFAAAVAKRYSGSFVPSTPPAQNPPTAVPILNQLLGSLGNQQQPQPQPQKALPPVGMFTIWNEPNLGQFLEPQWRQSNGQAVPASPQIYRQLVYGAYPAIKNVDPGATVLVGGTAGAVPSGDDGVPPLQFIRALACVDQQLRPLDSPDCQNFKPIPGDGWAHHAYALGGPPGKPTKNPNDATIFQLGRLTVLLDRLVAMGRLSPGLRDLWITEYGYPTRSGTESKGTGQPFSQAAQARYLAWGEYVAWSTPHVRSFAQFMIQDVPTFPTGLYQSDGSPKLAAQTFPDTLWAQHPLPPPAWAGVASSHTMTAWVHVRAARTPQQVQILGLVHGRKWAPLSGKVGWGANAGHVMNRFTTDSKGYLLVRLHPDSAQRLQLAFLAASGWQHGPALPAQAIAVDPWQYLLGKHSA